MSSDSSDESDSMILKTHRTYTRKRAKPANPDEDPSKTIEFETSLYVNKQYLGKPMVKYHEDDSDEEDYTDIDEIIAPGMTFTMKYIHTGNYYVEKTMDVTYISRFYKVDDYWEKYITLLGCVLKPLIPISAADKSNYRASHITLMKGDTCIAEGSINKLLITSPVKEPTP